MRKGEWKRADEGLWFESWICGVKRSSLQFVGGWLQLVDRLAILSFFFLYMLVIVAMEGKTTSVCVNGIVNVKVA